MPARKSAAIAKPKPRRTYTPRKSKTKTETLSTADFKKQPLLEEEDELITQDDQNDTAEVTKQEANDAVTDALLDEVEADADAEELLQETAATQNDSITSIDVSGLCLHIPTARRVQWVQERIQKNVEGCVVLSVRLISVAANALRGYLGHGGLCAQEHIAESAVGVVQRSFSNLFSEGDVVVTYAADTARTFAVVPATECFKIGAVSFTAMVGTQAYLDLARKLALSTYTHLNAAAGPQNILVLGDTAAANALAAAYPSCTLFPSRRLAFIAEQFDLVFDARPNACVENAARLVVPNTGVYVSVVPGYRGEEEYLREHAVGEAAITVITPSMMHPQFETLFVTALEKRKQNNALDASTTKCKLRETVTGFGGKGLRAFIDLVG